MAEIYYIGIEAANRTVALLATADGEVVGRGTAGPSTYSVVGQERCSQALWTAIIGAFSAAGYNTRDLLATESSLPEVGAICVGMPGIERPKDESAIKRILADFNLTETNIVTSEAHTVLMAGIEAGYGVCVLAGDNGLAFGLNRNGTRARAGGGGYLLGEEGSAYWVGLEAVKAVLAEADGRGPETSLTEIIGLEWKISGNRADALANKVYKLAASLGTGGNKAQLEDTVENYKRQVGALASLVERAAQKGDNAAGAILDRGAEQLDRAVMAVINKAGLNQGATLVNAAQAIFGVTTPQDNGRNIPLAFSGSLLLSNQGELRQRLVKRLQERCSAPVLVTEPAEGALRLALQS